MTGQEMTVEQYEMALELHRNKLQKMYECRDKLNMDIESVEMAIQLFQEKLGGDVIGSQRPV